MEIYNFLHTIILFLFLLFVKMIYWRVGNVINCPVKSMRSSKVSEVMISFLHAESSLFWSSSVFVHAN